MNSAVVLLVVLWTGLTLYTLFGGADFGGGLWDLLAGGAERGKPQRELIEHSIGPVWEANHVWLIFVITLFWTGFPTAFAAFAATLYIPLTLAALGIIARGAAFAFRKVSDELWQRRLFGAAFAFSSLVTPFFLGTTLGAVASRRVPTDIAAGDPLTSWLNPTSITTGVLAVATTAYLAAVYLTADARRTATPELSDAFRRRALLTGAGLGVLTLAALPIVRVDAPHLFTGLTGPALPLVAGGVVAGVLSMALLLTRRYLIVRITAALAVATILWAWAVAQYPVMLPGLTVHVAATSPAVLDAVLWVLAVGAAVLIPSLIYLYTVFQREHPPHATHADIAP
ncbi:cytochrome bd-I ubiquinol oxidase subunit 2 apoprotein [Lentzea albidocapillata subsp. violacea]|uniref:Cytochrome bd-I ubiquinol oxidase subunit 2 apoprotein n=1 Tax=Lentzea albidocapillata subsp. violacea TaxID=128104 RepID=A0A1H0ALW5_9PSEU|nr:cytochrome d ubiquinol oxidase subunit II [Lentzea albidocapillata]SDN34562.1 cytochrome bd-I ubiquinol oxidase subunit 2 apoprotein [Lentzea albidocapillata subsp. violacea]